MAQHHSHWMKNGLIRRPGDLAPLVASRGDALARLLAAASLASPGPVLITGEPGAGKTWLATRFAAEAPDGWLTASVDLAAAMKPVDFLRLAGRALGISVSNRLGHARIRLQDALADEATEGRRWLLVLDEAHRARRPVWDEVQAIANQLGRPRGFAGLFIVGDTELARSFSSRRSMMGLASQVSTHLHLGPLDLDEARDLLSSAEGASIADEGLLEELHRRSHGNPAFLIRLANTCAALQTPASKAGADRVERLAGRPPRGPVPPLLKPSASRAEAQPDSSREVVKEQNGSTTTRRGERGADTESAAAALIPSKPPIRDEDGLVEVGWEGDLENDLAAVETPSRDRSTLPADQAFPHEEMIEDHYAALQAMTERAHNLAWPAVPSAEPAQPPATTAFSSESEVPADRLAASDSGAITPPGGIRAEGQHEFAPYGQLFGRFRQSRPAGS
jgi:general secretion pathway protein A